MYCNAVAYIVYSYVIIVASDGMSGARDIGKYSTARGFSPPKDSAGFANAARRLRADAAIGDAPRRIRFDMVPILLTCTGIGDSDSEFRFDGPDADYSVNVAEDLKKRIGYAFFGNDALYEGRIRFEFGDERDTYVVERDFERNRVTLTQNGEEISETEIDERLKSFLGLSAGQWGEYGLGSKQRAFDGLKRDVSAYANQIYSTYGIPTTLVAEHVKHYDKEVTRLDSQMALLREFVAGDRPNRDSLEELKGGIDALKNEIAETNRAIGRGMLGERTAKKISELRAELDEINSGAAEIEEKKRKLARSKAIKEHFVLIEAAGEAEGKAALLRDDLDIMEKRLKDLEDSVKTGAKVYKIKEKEYVESNKRVVALNEVFDRAVAESRHSPQAAESVLKRIQSYCDEGDRRLNARRQSLSIAQGDLDAITEKIRINEEELRGIRYGSAYRRAVREGACYEIGIGEKHEILDHLQSQIKSEEETLSSISARKAENRRALDACQDAMLKIFAGLDPELRTFNNATAKYNDLEAEKQALYRDQILSATLLQDIHAIDAKISENTDLRRNCAENRIALEGAKKTLVTYMTKCADAIKARTEDLNAVRAERKYCENVDSLEYGGVCPVCMSEITEKRDCEALAKELASKEKAISLDLDRLNDINAEYLEKLAKINLRLGSYDSSEKSSGGYISSLERTKIRKMSVLGKIYGRHGVKSHEALTSKLESIISEIGRYGAAICDAKAIKVREEDVEYDNVGLDAHFDVLSSKVLPGRKADVARIDKEIEEFEKGYANYSELFETSRAVERIDDLANAEHREEELNAILAGLNEERVRLEGEIAEHNREIAILEGRMYPIRKDDVELDYKTLCVKMAEERYNEIIDEIRAKEEIRNRCQDEVIAVNRVVEDKTSKASELRAQVDEYRNRHKVLVSYAETLRASESYDSKLLEGADYESVKAEVLDDEAASSLEAEIKSRDESIVKRECELEALNHVVEETHSELGLLDANRKKLIGLVSDLDARTEQYLTMSNRLNFVDEMESLIASLARSKQDSQRGYSDLTDIMENRGGDVIITKTNNALGVLLPTLRIRLKGDAISMLSSGVAGDEKELLRAPDEEYVALTVSAINAVRQIVGESVNAELPIRIVRVRASSVGEALRKRLTEFGRKNNLIVIFYK